MNTKIMVGIGCVLIAGASQYFMMLDEPQYKFKNMMGFHCICVFLYGLFMAFYYYIDYFMVGEMFFVSYPHKVSSTPRLYLTRAFRDRL